jgi:uncharacterized damage-inducible protein DinB
MKKAFSMMAMMAVAVVLAMPAGAQEQTKKDAPKAAASPSQALLEAWNDVGRKLTAMAEDFPEEKYDFKPVPGERSFAEQLLHAAGANYFFIKPALGEKLPPPEDPKREEYKSKAAIVAFVTKSFADGAAVIKAKGDAGMNELLTNPFSNQQVRLGDTAWGLLEHSGEHYGQLVVYYRVAGLVPPESRPKK